MGFLKMVSSPNGDHTPYPGGGGGARRTQSADRFIPFKHFKHEDTTVGLSFGINLGNSLVQFRLSGICV